MEYSVNGVVVETRMLEKASAGWYQMAFVWDGDDAWATPGGKTNVAGTTHDVPSTAECASCHGNPARDELNGVSAVQSERFWPSWDRLGRFSTPAAGRGFPGDVYQSIALARLHVDCSHCHSGPSAPRGLDLGTRATDTTAETTGPYRTAIGKPLTGTNWSKPGVTLRIAPGNPDLSGVWLRMSMRGTGQMPPLGTKVVRSDDKFDISDWITKLK
jgi:hypothetical protein